MIIALNNKCNLTKQEFREYQNALSEVRTEVNMILCPNMTNIANFSTFNNCYLGAQNVSKFPNGAHTGEVSAEILRSHGVSFCIVGHSERRENGETDEDVKEKVLRLFEQGIIPILCIGETFRQRQENEYTDVLINEITSVTDALTEEQKNRLIIAYEPIWSIGTGIIPENSEIEEVFALIKQIVPASKVLYGGSANEKNVETINKCKNLDGYLLGGLSLKPEDLQTFIDKIQEK